MTSKETKRKHTTKEQKTITSDYLLILHNDDVHSFEYVIDALIEVCEHDYEQALQCTLITHHTGSCDIRKGNLRTLRKMKSTLNTMELSTTIELLL
jgi:ATP-dependent Clp protease adaptor protein ClpS